MTYSEKLKDPRWQKKRLLILERDEWTCQACRDSESTLNVHHIKYFGDPWECPDTYLITLCESCHQKESELKNIDFYSLVQDCGITRIQLALILEHVSFVMKRGQSVSLPSLWTMHYNVLCQLIPASELGEFVNYRLNGTIQAQEVNG